MQNKELKIVTTFLFVITALWSLYLLFNFSISTKNEINNSLFSTIYIAVLILGLVGMILGLMNSKNQSENANFEISTADLGSASIQSNQESNVKTNKTVDIKPLVAKLSTYNKSELTKGDNPEKILREICNYFELGLGIIYLPSPGKEDVMEVVGTYSCIMPEGENKFIFTGLGINGQALKDKTPFLLNTIPDNYHKVISGLGELNPKSILIVPCTIENEVISLFELASLQNIDSETKEAVISVCNLVYDSK